jgi:hypothetical protein
MNAKGHKKLTVWLPKETKNKLKRISRKEKRSMTAQLEKMIDELADVAEPVAQTAKID